MNDGEEHHISMQNYQRQKNWLEFSVINLFCKLLAHQLVIKLSMNLEQRNSTKSTVSLIGENPWVIFNDEKSLLLLLFHLYTLEEVELGISTHSLLFDSFQHKTPDSCHFCLIKIRYFLSIASFNIIMCSRFKFFVVMVNLINLNTQTQSFGRTI